MSISKYSSKQTLIFQALHFKPLVDSNFSLVCIINSLYLNRTFTLEIYKYVKNSNILDYNGAEAACVAKGGHLPTIGTVEQNTELDAMMVAE